MNSTAVIYANQRGIATSNPTALADLKSKTVDELYQMAKTAGLAVTTKTRKGDLLKKLGAFNSVDVTDKLTARQRRRLRKRSNQALIPTKRLKARQTIVGVAHNHRLMLGLVTDPVQARHLQRSVAVVRRNKLVKPAILADAGFRKS